MSRREHSTEERGTSDTKLRVGRDDWYPLVADLPRIAHVLIAWRGKDAEIDIEECRFIRIGHTHSRMMVLGRNDQGIDLRELSRRQRWGRTEHLAREACAKRLVIAPTRDIHRVVKQQRQEHQSRTLAGHRAQLLDARHDMIPRVIVASG